MSIQQKGGMKAPSILSNQDLKTLGELITLLNEYNKDMKAGGSSTYATVQKSKSKNQTQKGQPKLKWQCICLSNNSTRIKQKY